MTLKDELSGRGLSDYDLSTPTNVSNLGQAGGPLGGPSELTKSLQEVGPAPTYGGALKKTLGAGKGLGALGAALSIIGGAALAGPAGGLAAAGAFNRGVVGRTLAQDQEEYAGLLSSVEERAKAEEKISTRVSTLLGQKPELFEGVDPMLIGNLVAPGTGLALGPTAMLQRQRITDARKSNLDYLKTLWPDAATPTAKKAVAALMFANMGYNMDPTDKDYIPESIFNQFWQQDGEFTDDQLVQNFGTTGIEAARIRQETGQLPYDILRIVSKDAEGKLDMAAEAFDILDQAQAEVDRIAAEEGRFVSITQVLDTFPEKDQAIVANKIPEVYGDRLNKDDAIRIYSATIQSAGPYGAVKRGLFQGDFKAAIRREVSQALTDANSLGRIKEDTAFSDMFLGIAARIQAADVDGKLTKAEIVARARQVAEQQWKTEGRGPLPTEKKPKPKLVVNQPPKETK